jgi:deoxycytidine triphosphate deaminase
MESETETDCLIQQAQAIKEIVEEAGTNLLQPDSVDQFSDKIFEFIRQSENRIQENNKYEKDNMQGEEEDQLDEEDLMVLKEENKNEQQLQLDLGEIIGVLFKTHRDYCQNLA